MFLYTTDGKVSKGVHVTNAGKTGGVVMGNEFNHFDWTGLNIQRQDGRWTHFDWVSDGKNYIRGDTGVDGTLSPHQIDLGAWKGYNQEKGKIVFQPAWDPNSLSIVGGPNNAPGRRVRIFDQLQIGDWVLYQRPDGMLGFHRHGDGDKVAFNLDGGVMHAPTGKFVQWR